MNTYTNSFNYTQNNYYVLNPVASMQTAQMQPRNSWAYQNWPQQQQWFSGYRGSSPYQFGNQNDYRFMNLSFGRRNHDMYSYGMHDRDYRYEGNSSNGFSINWASANRHHSKPNRNIHIEVKRNKQKDNSNLFFLEDLKGGGDKDYNDTVFRAKGLNKEGHDPGVFCVDQSGKVETDFLFDGGAYNGEVGIFSLEGLEHLDKNSAEFRKHAIERVKSNSQQGRAIVSDPDTGAKYTSGKFANEKSHGGGDYKGKQTFDFKPHDKVAMIYLGNSKFSDVNSDNPPAETYLSTGSADNFEHFKVTKDVQLPEDSGAALNKLNEALGGAKGIREMQTA